MTTHKIPCDLCKCPTDQKLPAEFVITQYGNKRVLDKACPTCVAKALEAGKVTFTLLESLQFFQGLALDTHSPQSVKLKIRKDHEKTLCSRPDCDGETHGKSVTVYGIVYEICSCCSVAAFVAANRWGGPWPQGVEKAIEQRFAANTTLRVSLMARLGLKSKPAPQPTETPTVEASPRQKRPNGKKARKAAQAKADSPKARATEPSSVELRDRELETAADALTQALGFSHTEAAAQEASA